MGCYSKEAGIDGEQKESRCICLSSFSNLSHVSPAMFIYLLKECYIYGTLKATSKFRILQHIVLRALENAPQPGPLTFIVHCLYIIPLLGPVYAEGFSHMVVSRVRNFKSLDSLLQDYFYAKKLAAQLVVDILDRAVLHDERILIKLLEGFDLELTDIAYARCGAEFTDEDLEMTIGFLEHHVHGMIESESFLTAVKMLEQFSIQFQEEPLLVKLIEYNQFQAAEMFAAYAGKAMTCLLVQMYLDMKMLKHAYKLMKLHNLAQEFPDVNHMYKESVLKNLAEKGCWDVAEERAKKDKKLVKLLVYLALEAGYTEKVDELCQRYSLDGFINSLVLPDICSGGDYLNLSNLVFDGIVWVDEVDGLLSATEYIEGCKLVGIDCEWKPNYEKGSRPNKVSIMQIASEKRAFIFDLIKLYSDEREVLDSCFRRFLCSSNILKLGYNIQCDLRQLSLSYGELECFRSYEMVLDIQKMFKVSTGGLSGLSKKILGVPLNKTRRNSNWEQRPLSQHQKEYAALDAAVLVRIFHHANSHSFGVNEGCNVEWKSQIMSRMKSGRICINKKPF